MTVQFDDILEEFDSCMRSIGPDGSIGQDGRFIEMTESSIWLNGFKAGVLRALTLRRTQNESDPLTGYELFNIFNCPSQWQVSKTHDAIHEVLQSDFPDGETYRLALARLRDRLLAQQAMCQEVLGHLGDLDPSMDKSAVGARLNRAEAILKDLVRST